MTCDAQALKALQDYAKDWSQENTVTFVCVRRRDAAAGWFLLQLLFVFASASSHSMFLQPCIAICRH